MRRERRSLFLFISLLLFFAGFALSTAAVEARFPRPQFDRKHPIPREQRPARNGRQGDVRDGLALLLALGLSAFLALRRRSRRGLFWLGLVCLAYFGFWRQGCVCPVGSIQNISRALLIKGAIIPVIVLLFFLLPLAFALFFGRVFCGAVCPLGIIQDLFVLYPMRLPYWLNRMLGVLPRVYLVGAVLLSGCGAGFFICRYDPFVGFFRLNASASMLLFGGGLLVLGVFIARPYCRFLCPYGVLLGWCAMLAKKKLRIAPEPCIQCRLCEAVCPFDAIHSSESATPEPEPPRRRTRRLFILLLWLPFALAVGAGTGYQLAPILARAHRDVALVEELKQESLRVEKLRTPQKTKTTGMADSAKDSASPSLEVQAFLANGEARSTLQQRAGAVQARFRIGAPIAGAVLALLLMGRLLALCVAVPRQEYEPDPADCLSCGRCLQACPLDPKNYQGAPK